MSEQKAQTKRILTIDGGGLKGALPAALLAEVEARTGKRIVDHFDLIAGTSTGGIIAMGLGLGLSAREILEFYKSRGPGIFGQSIRPSKSGIDRCLAWLRSKARSARQIASSKYSNDELKFALNEILQNRRIGESQTRLVIPAFDSINRRPYIFKTAHHERLKHDYARSAVDAILATAAAPTYFDAHDFAGGSGLRDGGVWANNPMGVAAIEAATILNWDMTNVRMLALGCTDNYVDPIKNAGLSSYKWLLDVMFQGQASSSASTAKLLLGHTTESPRIWRVDTPSPKSLSTMDDASKINDFAGLGAAAARNSLPDIEKYFLYQKSDPFTPYYK